MLRLGRIKETVYHRSVLKQLHNEKGDAPFFTQTLTVEGWTLAAERIVFNMINAFSAEQTQVAQIDVSIIMPEGTEEPIFREFTKAMGRLCQTKKIWLKMEDCRVISGLQKPIFHALGMGDGQEARKLGKLSSGMDILVAGSVACEGAAILALEEETALKERFASFYVEIAQQLFDAAAMPAVRDILTKEEAWGTAVREGGIFAGLWQLAAAGKVGLDIDLSAVPIRQHTIEVCEFFNLNPYMLLSGGCMLIVACHGEKVISALAEQGISATIIGHTTSNNDKIIRYDDEIRYLEPPKTDEIYKKI